ncbi:tRNA N6-adenosine threonylcarbamoyltransferase [Seminavis robusta]|uniref:N(6)-L-threonylcarbamoyladenine synthase n=1 Tax=Seminavis robusta TaxID=568900 RepID=A0A9N8EA51_9STRA|nr:tRNA N6-adenosine threonylcarbamoyltransferase [Seminavis robusta]|eukprot:Sro716_g191880.1 tRNA N6-adenosine threonylcarbamoyltransferase (512) ;mRNA; r:23552-25087
MRGNQAPLLTRIFSTDTGTTASTSTQENATQIVSNLQNQTTRTGTHDNQQVHRNKKKEKRFNEARNKRRKLIGLAKAMDHGQPGIVTYQLPRHSETKDYLAASGLPDRTRPFTVLGIESSCDDTGAAVVRSDGVILGEALASQGDIHEQWGGVVPGLARDAHEDAIDRIVDLAVERAGFSSIQEIDAIGVTIGPGLEICLRVGATKARELAQTFQKPFVGVHHLEAHILMARLPLEEASPSTATTNNFVFPATDLVHETVRTMQFPFLALLVSGGHCQIMKCLDIGKYSIIGGTLDDSLGEAYDKVARLLGLPVGGGGGPAVEALAKQGDPTAVPLPIPLRNRKDCDFSFAGLKTAVRRAAEKICDTEMDGNLEDLLTDQDKANIAASFQNVAIKHIEQRLERAMKMVEQEEQEQGGSKIRSLAVVGGVAANQELRARLETLCERCSSSQDNDDDEEDRWKMFVPPPRLCTDQGSMSAWAAIERIMVGSTDDPTSRDVYARYPFSLEHEAK